MIFLYLLYISLGCLYFVPQILDISSIIFIVLYTIFFLLTIIKKKFYHLNFLSILILLFLAYLLTINFFVAYINATEITFFIRGLIPFLFLSFYLNLNSINLSSYKLWNMILTTCSVWLFGIILKDYQYFPSVLRGDIGRLTHIDINLLTPFGLIGYVLSIYSKHIKFIYKIFLSISFLTIIILSGYRSQLLIVIMITLFHSRKILSIKSISILASLLISFLIILYNSPELINNITRRFYSENVDDVRKNEILFSIEQFVDAPLFGKGLAFPIPVSQTRGAVMGSLFNENEVRYIHNIFFYFLMDTGIIGTFLIVTILLFPLKDFLQIFKKKNLILEGASMCLLSLIAFFLVSASFRQIQTIVITMSLIKIINNENKKLKNIR